MVVTNVRMPTSEYRQLKSLAASAGISVNEYIRTTIKSSTMRKIMAVDEKLQLDTIDSFYTDMLALAKSVPNVKVYDVSDDDAIIYGIYD